LRASRYSSAPVGFNSSLDGEKLSSITLEIHSPQQILKARLCAQRIELATNFEPDHYHIALFVRALQKVKSVSGLA
jgi:hypothetical protein